MLLDHEITGIHYLSPENQITDFTVPVNYSVMQTNLPPFQFNRFLNNMPNSTLLPLGHEYTTKSSSVSNNSSTSDETDQQQLGIIDERKQRRMISNRESARRSRMRKQRHLDELCSQVLRLQNENQLLVDRLNHVCETHDKVLQENVRLKDETSELRQTISDMQLGSPFNNLSRNLEEVPCNTAHLRAESSSQSINNSVNLLH